MVKPRFGLILFFLLGKIKVADFGAAQNAFEVQVHLIGSPYWMGKLSLALLFNVPNSKQQQPNQQQQQHQQQQQQQQMLPKQSPLFPLLPYSPSTQPLR